ncbi:MAG: formylglycine-generating enzyme family protein [bacterium]|nr:formylglycine-generating enzyme family protein [bacterium]
MAEGILRDSSGLERGQSKLELREALLPDRVAQKAYCRWLSEQRGEEIRLPSGKEWEKAATAPKGKYPWGSAEPDAERANFSHNVSAPTPVGVYPAGDGPYRHCDLGGNVWEWSADRYEDVEDRDVRVLRGGSWDLSADLLRAAYRGRYSASDRSSLFGFRVLVVPASLGS